MRDSKMLLLLAAAVALIPSACSRGNGNLLADPSFEVTKSKDQFGLVFARWGGWKYEGDCDFRVGEVARTGKHSCLLYGGIGAKIRVAQNVELTPGRYRVTAYLRGLDIGTGTYNVDHRVHVRRQVSATEQERNVRLDQAHLRGRDQGEEAGRAVVRPDGPRLFLDRRRVAGEGRRRRPADRGAGARQRGGADRASGRDRAPPPSGARNADTGTIPAEEPATPAARRSPRRTAVAAGPGGQVDRLVRGSESRSRGARSSPRMPPPGRKALRLDRSYVSMDQPQDWLGYDFLKADLYTDARKPLDLYVEIRDAGTRDYWTRVNYSTVVPPGQSTLIIPVKQLYVGEKSRPGRMLDLGRITRLVFGIGDAPAAPLFLDNLRLERDDSPARVVFDGLHAFDFGTSTSPVMEGFTPITPATLYSKGRGYGLKDARIWRAFDALQPDPLYQDFLCIEAGGLAVDVPNGKYRVFVNIDSPSGFWGEYQTYRKRAILAEGRPVVSETMDFEAFRKKYFRFWNVEDLPADNTFDKYQKAYFHEKQFDVEVTDGQLNLEFQGENWACSRLGRRHLPGGEGRPGRDVPQLRGSEAPVLLRQLFQAGPAAPPAIRCGRPRRTCAASSSSSAIRCRTSPTTTRRFKRSESGVLRGEAFAGEYEPVTLALVPLRDLGKVTLSVSDLDGAGRRRSRRARSTSVTFPTGSAG